MTVRAGAASQPANNHQREPRKPREPPAGRLDELFRRRSERRARQHDSVPAFVPGRLAIPGHRERDARFPVPDFEIA